MISRYTRSSRFAPFVLWFCALTLLRPLWAEVGSLPGSFSVDNKGAANYSIPLSVPPGRSGLQPSLALNYSSDAGNGPLGIGWSVSTGFPEAIARGRSILARDGYVKAVSFNSDDRLYLDGKLLLHVNKSSPSAPYLAVGNEYRTEVDSFIKVTALGANGATTGSAIEAFKIERNDGTIFYLGNIDSTSGDAVRKFYATEAIYSWHIKKATDSLGNLVRFGYNVYENDLFNYLTNTNGRLTGEHLLARIDYTANPSAEIAATFGVRLIYTPGSPRPSTGDAERPDVYEGYLAGRANEVRRRLERVEAGTFSAQGDVVPFTRYNLTYETSPSTGLTRLKQVELSQKKDAASSWESVPATVLTYNNDGSDGALEVPDATSTSVAVANVLMNTENRHKVSSGDFNGDGLPDKHMAGKVYLGTGSGFAAGVQWRSGAEIGSISRAGDVDGDGRSDIINISSNSIYVSRSTGTSFGNFYTARSLGGMQFDVDVINQFFDAWASRYSIGDFNGDGRSDVLIHFSSPVTGFTRGLYVCLSDGVNFAAPVKWGEIIGHDEFSEYWAGEPGNPPTWGEWVPNVTDIEPMVVDFNADGCDDYAYIERNVEYYEGSGGGITTVLYSSALKVATVAYSSYMSVSTLHWSDKSVDWAYAQMSDAPLLKAFPGDCNGDGYQDLLVLCDRPVSPGVRTPKWCLFAGGGGGFSDPVENYMPMDDPVALVPNHNIDLLMASDYGLYFWAGTQLQTGGMFLQDVNRDGRADFIYGRNDTDGWLIKYGKKGGFETSQPLWSYNAGGLGTTWGGWGGYTPYFDGTGAGGVGMETLDIDGDGANDLMLLNMMNSTGSDPLVARTRNALADRLVKVVDGLGAVAKVDYGSTVDSSIYTPGVAVSYPIREVRSPKIVVSDLWKDNGNDVESGWAHFTYQYSGNRLDLSGRGSLGFHSFVTLDAQTNVFKYQFLTQSFPMTGLAAREQTYRYWTASEQAKFRLISTHDNTVVFDKVVNGSNAAYGTLYPFISKAVESRWEDSTTAHFSTTPAASESQPEYLFPQSRPTGAHITITAESWFDNQALTSAPQTTVPTGFEASDRNASGQNIVGGTATTASLNTLLSALPGKITFGNLRQLKTDFENGYTEKVVTTYLSAPANTNLTNRVHTVTTTVESPGYGSQTAPTKTYSYFGNTSLVASEQIDAAGSTLDHTNATSRDNLGRITGLSVTGSGLLSKGAASSTLTTYQATGFDSRFDLPTTEKNAYGHTTTTTYHPLFAKPSSVTDANNVVVSTDYDSLARPLTVSRTVGGLTLSTTNTYAWTTSSTANDWKKVQTVGDPGGIVSLPGVSVQSLSSVYALRTTATAQPPVTTYYDRLGRVIRTIKEGFGSAQIYADTVYNNLGQVVAVSLPYASGGTAYWTRTEYDPFGRVTKVTAPNGTVTTTTYKGSATIVSVDAPNLGGDDPAAQVNATVVDAKGRTVKVWNADNVPTFSDNLGTTTTAPSIAFALDGFGRMRTTTQRQTASTTIAVTADYDALGRQTALNDPDKGPWSYLNSPLGHVLEQTDARGYVTNTIYDRLGRPLTRTTGKTGEPTEAANWYYYDSVANTTHHHVAKTSGQGWIGALQREESVTTNAPGYAAANSETKTVHYYDSRGNPSIDLTTIDGKWFYTYRDYYADTNLLKNVRHYWRPAGHEQPDSLPYVWQDFGYTYNYDSKGYLTSLTDSNTPARTWWEIASDGYDHLDRPVKVRKGSGHWTQRAYRATDGVLSAIATGPTAGATSIQNLSFAFDGLGNLRSRTGPGGTETLTYDALNRLTSNWEGSISYFDNGNIKNKAAVGGATSTDFTYDTNKPHAVATAFGYTMGYDANGNLISRTKTGESWDFRYAGFDKPRWMAKTVNGATNGSEFLYDANRSRTMHLEFTQLSGGVPSGYERKRIYGFKGALELNYRKQASATDWGLDLVRIYVSGPEGTIGAREFQVGESPDSEEKALVYHHDHLGSIDAITDFADTTVALAADDSGNPGRFSEDAWGQRRNPFTWNGAPVTTGTNASDNGGADSLTPRGFTGHEMLDDLGLVHMNGRIYDPLLGRFLSADPLVQAPANLQSYNRYSYVFNNPLSFVDPTGFKTIADYEKDKENALATRNAERTALDEKYRGKEKDNGYNRLLHGIESRYSSAVRGANQSISEIVLVAIYADKYAQLGLDNKGLGQFASSLDDEDSGFKAIQLGVAYNNVAPFNGALREGMLGNDREAAALLVKEVASYAIAFGAGRALGALSQAGVRAGLQESIAAESGLARGMGILREAAKGTGNYGLGTATRAEAMKLGEAWVGKGYKVASDGRTLLSADGLRQFRPPSPKASSFATTGTQANFEIRSEFGKAWSGNGHLNIVDP